MSNRNRPTRPGSLDELLQANKDRFDTILATQMRKIGTTAAAKAPIPDADRPSPDPRPTTTEQDETPRQQTVLALAAPSAPASDQARPRAEIDPDRGLDGITLDLIEAALGNARRDMDTVLSRLAMSATIREGRDVASMVTDAKGRMIVGAFGSYVTDMLRRLDADMQPGDVILHSDPYACGGAVSHLNDWTILLPIFHDDALIGFSSVSGHMGDVGGAVPGSMPTAATSIFGEGIRIPPIKLYARGEPNRAVFDLLMNNSRTPEVNHGDLMAIVAGCQAGARRVTDICDRFGVEFYRQACAALLARGNRTMRQLIEHYLPEEPQSFEDYVDDDGLGNGPFKIKLTVWREGDQAFFDWTGTSAQAPGPINFYLNDSLFKMFVGVYLARAVDPQLQLNDGFHDLIHVTLPKGSLLRPAFPAPLGGRAHALARHFDVLGGALSRNVPEVATAAGYGSSPQFRYAGTDRRGRPFQLVENIFGGLPGRPAGDGIDGHSWQPLLANVQTEYLESSYPMLVERHGAVPNSGGAGKHRGGNGVEKVYLLLEPGEVSIHDDRERTRPWGIMGGRPGAFSAKWIERKDGVREPLPSKADNVKVRGGDRVIFRTAGAGGWGDPLARDPARVRDDVARGLLTPDVAKDDYGVVLTGEDRDLDVRATEELRDGLRRNRRAPPAFDFGERRRDNDGGDDGAN